MRVPFRSANGFRFSIRRSGLFISFADAFGIKRIYIGKPLFDRDYVIKGNDDQKARALFSNIKIRKLIRSLGDPDLEIKDNDGWSSKPFPHDVDELFVMICGVVKDAEKLMTIYELCTETMTTLVQMGVAHEGDPKVQLI
jgi:hypothetical protein